MRLIYNCYASYAMLMNLNKALEQNKFETKK